MDKISNDKIEAAEKMELQEDSMCSSMGKHIKLKIKGRSNSPLSWSARRKDRRDLVGRRRMEPQPAPALNALKRTSHATPVPRPAVRAREELKMLLLYKRREDDGSFQVV